MAGGDEVCEELELVGGVTFGVAGWEQPEIAAVQGDMNSSRDHGRPQAGFTVLACLTSWESRSISAPRARRPLSVMR